MADTIIAASLTVNPDDAVKAMLKAKSSVEEYKKELKNAKEGTDEQVAAFKKLKAAEEDLAKANKQLAEANKEQAGHFSKIKGSLNEIPGAAGNASKGVTALSGTFKALLANPIVLIIVAIVGALTLLYKAFTSTNDGADKMEQVMKGLGAVIDVIRDRILKIAGAIAKFFSGDFSGALSDARAAVSGIGDEIAAEFQKAADATRRLQEVEDAFRSLGVSRAKLNRDLAETKEIITDETASLDEKRKAIERVRKAEGEQTTQELESARKKLKAIQDLNALSDTSDEDLQKEADAQAAVYALEEKSANDIRALNKQSRTLERQEEAKRKEERAKLIEQQKAERQKLVEFTNKLTKLQQDNELALIKDGYQRELKALENRIADEKRQNELAFKDRKLTADQLKQLNAALDIQANIQRDSINEKHNQEVATKEAAFQKELADIATKIRLTGITDARQLELTQLEIGYNEKLAQAITRYKDDAAKLAQVQAAIDEQYRAERAAKEAKFKEEDDKKKLEKDLAAQEKIFNDQTAAIEARQAAVDQEQVLIQQAFDNKVISEEDYNSRVEALAEKRKKILELETEHRKKQVTETADVLNKLSDLIGKKTAAGKLLAIAAASINTFQGASEALKQPSTLPSPFDVIAKIANVATVIATGLATVKSITAVQLPGGSSGGSVPTAPSLTTPAAPVAPTQASTSLDQGTIDNIGNAATGGVNSVRAYVVEQDSQAAAARAARLAGAAVLGG